VPPLQRTTPVRSFRVIYRVEQPNVPKRWTELIADRPFLIRAGGYDHIPTERELPDNGTLTTVDGLFQLRPEGVQKISGRQPSPGTGDQYLVANLDEAVDRNLAKPIATATIVDRKCTVYRFLEPPVGPIKRLSGDDHDDLCLTADGLVLREVWTLKGKVILRRTAIAVTIAPRDTEDALDVSDAAEAPPNGPVAAAAPSGSSFVPDPDPPARFSLARRDSFALRQPSDTGPVTLYTSTVWAFTRGADVVTVEAGDSHASGGRLPWLTSDPSRTVSLPYGEAQSVLRNDGAELRIDLGEERWLRVRGTVPLSTLVQYAKTLTVE